MEQDRQRQYDDLFSGEKANLGDGYITFVVTDPGSSFSVSSPGIVYSLIENTIRLSATDGDPVVEYTRITGNNARLYTYTGFYSCRFIYR